jgi:GNAT superfamily N-acetyltransferase
LVEKLTIERALEVFVTFFCQIRSRTRPYISERVEDLWVMRDPPGTKNPRKTEVVSHALPPAETVRRIRSAGLGWHFICDVSDGQDFAQVREAYKREGYRALGTEWLFTHDLRAIPVLESDPPVRLLESEAELAQVRQVARQKRKLMEGARLYSVFDQARDFGWVTSISSGPDAWTSDLFVHPEFRGQGYGRALMSRMLRDDKALGVRTNVLLASSAGARLYPHLGYQNIACLQIFCPLER